MAHLGDALQLGCDEDQPPWNGDPVQTPTGGSSGEYCTRGASLMQPCRVYEEGLRDVKYFQRGGRHCG